MTPIDVRVENVWKAYRLGIERRAETIWALNNVTFEVPRGSSFGVIGRNGAGKSTLLKLLASITAPTRGRIVVDGRLVALIEVGSGFHPELTGRENVFLSGAILGMRRREIAKKLSRIVEFAGVERFIDTPVKWYSSGMYVRLGFSIAAHLDPDVLLVDEVLAVGDAEFQAKCLARIQELQRRGATILLISHDLTAVTRLCDRAMLLERGEAIAIGRPADVVSLYHQRLTTTAIAEADFAPAAREGAVKIDHLTFGEAGPRTVAFKTGAPLLVSLSYTATRSIGPLVFELSYYSADGKTLVASTQTDRPFDAEPPGGVVEFHCDALPLRPGSYYVGAVVRERAGSHVIDWWDGGTMLYVESGVESAGQFLMPHTWKHKPRGERLSGARAVGRE
jgi:ABC-type polysaccharide/polyol phosphate transport system ATPase subunit